MSSVSSGTAIAGITNARSVTVDKMATRNIFGTAQRNQYLSINDGGGSS
jgi:hypothetical protein